MTCRRVLLGIAGGLAAHAALAAAPSPSYPVRPVRLVLPFSPGGGTDITARAIGHKLSERWGQQVIIDNRPGAGGNIGAEIVARASPDGYTLLAITASHTVNRAVQGKTTFDLLTDLTPISLVTALPYAMLITPSLPAKTVKEFVALAKSKPGGITYGSSGVGSLGHLSGALLGSSTGANANMLYVPYRGGAAAVSDVIAGQLNMTFATVLQAPNVRAGKLRALAVTTLVRSPAMPDVPTMVEAGIPGYEVKQWNGMLAPPRMPAALLARLNTDINAVLHLPDVKDRLAADGSEAVGTTPQEFGRYLKAEVDRWKVLSEKVGIKVE
jgi:tripartite-type tricarboxylate transporter receptor subunit TctC